VKPASVQTPAHNNALTLSVRADGVGCPFRDGPLALDALLAELSRAREGEDDAANDAALDLALELRHAFHATHDAAVCAALAHALCRTLGERHYLALYRVRLWLSRALAVERRAHRGTAWERYPFAPELSDEKKTGGSRCNEDWFQERHCFVEQSMSEGLGREFAFRG
jgi:hypothetical protein